MLSKQQDLHNRLCFLSGEGSYFGEEIMNSDMYQFTVIVESKQAVVYSLPYDLILNKTKASAFLSVLKQLFE